LITVFPRQFTELLLMSHGMKIEFFQTCTYAGPDHGASWPARPAACDPEWASTTFADALDECAVAVDAGFDTLTFAEHHYSPKQITPNPMMLAALAGARFPGQQIGVFGTDLPINNPVRVAEEYAMLDNLLQGRLRVAMLRGTPNEYITYFDNPYESRERAEEATLLVKQCWTEPEPFAWEGRYYRYRNIAVWPRVFQNPHPRILISANSPDGAMFAGRNGFDIGFSYMAPDACAANADLYRKTAAATGWTPTADNIQYRHALWVDEDEATAWQTFGSYAGGGLHALFAGASYDTRMALARCGMAMAGIGRDAPDTSGLAIREEVPPPPSPLVPGPPFVGTPESVIRNIKNVAETIGAGRVEVHAGFPVTGAIPTEMNRKMVALMGREVVPTVHAESW
jgi:alkanesulfonate monooxygenase SsuD/methylene tetrahydromethanopterin reductase-like flavin-dependent oxidoreductase (luciferase family)